jgi:biotin operon repressor
MTTLDTFQTGKYSENHEKILRALKDPDRPLTVVKLAKLTGLSRKTVYKHLCAMEAIGQVLKECSKFRLSSLWPLRVPIEELGNALKYISSECSPSEIIIPLRPKYIMTVMEKVRIFTKLDGIADICPACHQAVGKSTPTP